MKLVRPGERSITMSGPHSAGLSAPHGRYAEYHRRQDEALRAVPRYPGRLFGGAGIVIVAGGTRYFTCAWVCLTMLRQVLGCTLPIEVWYLGAEEMSPYMKTLLERFDVECVDALEVRRRHPVRRLGGWECKPYAVLHSRFEHVILIDADNVPLMDPALLLARPEYRATGALFWPDFGRLDADCSIWEICRVPYRDEPELESGQIVVDKEHSWQALHLAMHLNEWSDFYYEHIYGDKETFYFAWRMLGKPYALCPHPPRPVLYGSGAAARDILAFIQHGFGGEGIFQHRCGAKWIAEGRNAHVQGFAYERQCLAALSELRGLWDGRLDHESMPLASG